MAATMAIEKAPAEKPPSRRRDKEIKMEEEAHPNTIDLLWQLFAQPDGDKPGAVKSSLSDDTALACEVACAMLSRPLSKPERAFLPRLLRSCDALTELAPTRPSLPHAHWPKEPLVVARAWTGGGGVEGAAGSVAGGASTENLCDLRELAEALLFQVCVTAEELAAQMAARGVTPQPKPKQLAAPAAAPAAALKAESGGAPKLEAGSATAALAPPGGSAAVSTAVVAAGTAAAPAPRSRGGLIARLADESEETAAIATALQALSVWSAGRRWLVKLQAERAGHFWVMKTATGARKLDAALILARELVRSNAALSRLVDATKRQQSATKQLLTERPPPKLKNAGGSSYGHSTPLLHEGGACGGGATGGYAHAQMAIPGGNAQVMMANRARLASGPSRAGWSPRHPVRLHRRSRALPARGPAGPVEVAHDLRRRCARCCRRASTNSSTWPTT